MIRNLIVLPDGSQLFSGLSGAAIMDCALTRTVNSGEELTLGSVCSAMLEFTLIDPAAVSLTAGQEVTLWYVMPDDSRRQVGVFLLEKPVRSGASRCRVTAYDRVSLLDRDLTQWVKGLGSVTLAELATGVCSQCGLTLATKQIPNGSLTVPPLTGSELTGRQLMKWIGEAAGCFCRATPEGLLELAWYSPCDIALGPGASEAALVWEEAGNVSVSSRSVKTVDDNRGGVALTSPVLTLTHHGAGEATLSGLEQPMQIPWFQGTLELGDYRVAPVEAVQLRLGDGEQSVLWPEAEQGVNTYILSGNPILSRATGEVSAALQTLLTRLSAVAGYTPCRVNVPATEEILPGSMVTLIDTAGVTHTLPVMTVKRAGQRDTLECTGSARRDSASVTNYKTMDAIAQEKVDAQTQADIFRKLTDGGKLQGLYIQDGKLYINAEFVQIINLIAEKIRSVSEGKTVKIDEGEIRLTESVDGNDIHVGSIFSLNEILEVYSPKMLRIGGDQRTQLGNIGGLTAVYGYPLSLVADRINIGNEYGDLSLKGKQVSWRANGDGTYTLIGE